MTWTQLVPLARSAHIDHGLRGAIADPLWMLSRQWQLYEFRGADAGSPVSVDLTCECDDITSVDLRDEGETDGSSLPYEGGPIDPLIERETVMTDTDQPPGASLRAEAGDRFRQLLDDVGYGDFPPEVYPEEFLIHTPDEPLEAKDRRYFRVMGGHALDGYAIYRAIEKDAGSWKPEELPVPRGESVTEPYREAATAFTEWYAELYDEPTEASGSAWRPNRLEYDATITTGAGDPTQDGTLATFDVWASPGGQLEVHDFLPMEASSDDDAAVPSVAVDASSKAVKKLATREGAIPKQITFPGVPSQRWWEFSEATTGFAELSADGVWLARLLVGEYAIEYGEDWYSVPLKVPVGTYARITKLTVTDSFGREIKAEPVEDDWRLFRAEPVGHDRPGLLVPPTIPKVEESEPVEKVAFGRDEMANLVFALERLIEGPTGRPVNRTEFREPGLVIESVHMDDDPDAESVTFANPGEDTLEMGSYTVCAVTRTATGDEEYEVIHQFGPERVLEPDGSLRLYTGLAPVEEGVSATDSGSGPVWRDADALDVRDPTDPNETGIGKCEGRLIVRKLLSSPDAEGAYRLVTSVPSYWFPFRMTVDEDGLYRLHEARLLDADSLDAPTTEIPTPKGSILSPEDELLPPGEETLRLYEEEVTRSGREVARRYRLARSSDGEYHLWSGRDSTIGMGELASGLRFDILEEPE